MNPSSVIASKLQNLHTGLLSNPSIDLRAVKSILESISKGEDNIRDHTRRVILLAGNDNKYTSIIHYYEYMLYYYIEVEDTNKNEHTNIS